MIIDDILYYLRQYGQYPLLLIIILKFIMLFWYMPHKPAYAFKNFFRFYDRYSLKHDQKERWVKFRKI